MMHESEMMGAMTGAMMGGNLSWWWMPLGGLLMLAFWGGLVALVVWGIRVVVGPRDRRPLALNIAGERYARGDISREQFEEMRRALVS